MREDSSYVLPHRMAMGTHPDLHDWPDTQLQNVKASGFSLRCDVYKVTQKTEITLNPPNAHRTQPHTYHGNGSAKVQDPVLQCEVEPEVKVEGSCAVCLLSLHGAMPGKEQD